MRRRHVTYHLSGVAAFDVKMRRRRLTVPLALSGERQRGEQPVMARRRFSFFGLAKFAATG